MTGSTVAATVSSSALPVGVSLVKAIRELPQATIEGRRRGSVTMSFRKSLQGTGAADLLLQSCDFLLQSRYRGGIFSVFRHGSVDSLLSVVELLSRALKLVLEAADFFLLIGNTLQCRAQPALFVCLGGDNRVVLRLRDRWESELGFQIARTVMNFLVLGLPDSELLLKVRYPRVQSLVVRGSLLQRLGELNHLVLKLV